MPCKGDRYSAHKEITREDFVRLIGAIERGELDVVIVRDVDRLTRNLTDWNRFREGVRAPRRAVEPVSVARHPTDHVHIIQRA